MALAANKELDAAVKRKKAKGKVPDMSGGSKLRKATGMKPAVPTLAERAKKAKK